MNYTRQPAKEVQLPARLPLVGLPNQRLADPATDSRLINGYIELGDDGVIRTVKRPGLALTYDVGIAYGAGLHTAFDSVFAIFYVPIEGGFTGKLYRDGVFVTNLDTYPASTTIPPTRYYSMEFVPHLNDGVLFFHNGYVAYTVDGSLALRQVFLQGTTIGPLTCGITDTSAIVTAVSTSGLTVYATVAGTGIPAATFIESIDSPTQFTMSAPATATNAAAALSFVRSGPGDVGTGAKRLADGVVDLNKSTYLLTLRAVVQGSDLDTPYAWNPLNRIIAYANQDNAIAISKQLSYIIVFKSESIEFFRDAGLSPGSPLERLEGLRMDVGCNAGRTVQTVDGVVLWVSSTKSGLRSVWMLDGMKPREIATPAVRRLLETIEPTQSLSFSSNGHSFYIISAPASGVTFVYDLTAQHWGFWKGNATADFPYVAAASGPDAATGERKTYLQHRDNGQVVELTPLASEDFGLPTTMEIFPPQYDAGMRVSKYLNRMYAICDQTSGPSMLEVRINDSDQASAAWSDWRPFDLTHPRPAIWQCGSFTKRWFHFRHVGGSIRVIAVELDLIPGTL